MGDLEEKFIEGYLSLVWRPVPDIRVGVSKHEAVVKDGHYIILRLQPDIYAVNYRSTGKFEYSPHYRTLDEAKTSSVYFYATGKWLKL